MKKPLSTNSKLVFPAPWFSKQAFYQVQGDNNLGGWKFDNNVEQETIMKWYLDPRVLLKREDWHTHRRDFYLDIRNTCELRQTKLRQNNLGLIHLNPPSNPREPDPHHSCLTQEKAFLLKSQQKIQLSNRKKRILFKPNWRLQSRKQNHRKLWELFHLLEVESIVKYIFETNNHMSKSRTHIFHKVHQGYNSPGKHKANSK